MSNIGKTIKKIRAEKGLTQEQLAEQLHVTRQAVSNWEQEKTQPDVETLTTMAEVLEVSVEELIYGDATRTESKVIIEKTTKKGIDTFEAVGVALAVVLSYAKWQSIGWAIFHGLLNWVYIVYYLIKY